MEMRICKICGEEKEINQFVKIRENNYRNECKKCHSIKMREYRHNYYIKNKEKLNLKNKEWYSNHKEEMKKYNKKYYKQNKEKIITNVKKYRKNNLKRMIKKQEDYNNKKRKEDKLFRLKTNIRNTINRSFTRKEYQKNKHTEEIIGCSIDFFITYIINTYKENYGYEWDGIEPIHIDHKRPLKYATTEEEVMRLCNYKNLQLLKAKDNLQKSSKINYELKGE